MLSHDMENDPDVLGMVAASAALTLSGVPFLGPIAAARVGLIGGELVLNPMIDEMQESALDLIIAGTQDAVMMVESEAKELPLRPCFFFEITMRDGSSGNTGAIGVHS